MNSISEARELRRRINTMLDVLWEDWDFTINSADAMQYTNTIGVILSLTRNELDRTIDEWDAEKGIDRPL